MKKKSDKTIKTKPSARVAPETQLLGDLRRLIEAGRGQVGQAVNAGLGILDWSVSDRVRREILGSKRAEYTKAILPTLSAKSVSE